MISKYRVERVEVAKVDIEWTAARRQTWDIPVPRGGVFAHLY